MIFGVIKGDTRSLDLKPKTLHPKPYIIDGLLRGY